MVQCTGVSTVTASPSIPTGMVGRSLSMTTSAPPGSEVIGAVPAAAQHADRLGRAAQPPGDHAQLALVDPRPAAEVAQPAGAVRVVADQHRLLAGQRWCRRCGR